jgi:tRNA (mo5U34)-methyltransferase
MNAQPIDSKLLDEISHIKWFHQIDLGNGIITPGLIDTKHSLLRYQIPSDLSGKSFLDIGSWDGFFAFEAERRGAKRVLATDSFVWQGKTWGSKKRFDTARAILRSNVEDMTIDALELSPERIGKWDVVLFAGILYHMKHPLLALERAASVTRELLILESTTDYRFCRRPAMAFYPNDELSRDPTNWFGPNLPAIKAMLACCGFSFIKVVHKTSFAGQIRNALKLARSGEASPLASIQQGRVVVHARFA